MKVIVTGATGTAGRGIVQACLADERITKLTILTRRAVASEVEGDPRVEVVMHDDFSQYPDELMQRLEGSEACLWAVGGRVDQFGGDKDLARKVGVDYTLAGARAMRDKLAPKVSRFRFVFCSGMMAEWDQDKSLLFMNDTRKIKGAVEKGLCALADEQKQGGGEGEEAEAEGEGAAGKFEVWIARPSTLVPPEAPAHMKLVGALSKGISTVQLGRAMVKMAMEGSGERIVETDTLSRM